MYAAASREEEMENLVLDDDNSLYSKSYSNYTSAMSALSESHHPLAPPTPADSDPLLSPPLPLPESPKNRRNNAYVDPPSYADILFSPLHQNDDVEPNGLVQSPRIDSDKLSFNSRSPPSTSSEYLKVAVSNPQKEVESSNSIVPGGNTFITYLITTRTNLPEFGGSEFIVRRRFKDVVTLADRLSEAYRGFFIAPRPDKNVVESQVMQKQDFVE